MIFQRQVGRLAEAVRTVARCLGAWPAGLVREAGFCPWLKDKPEIRLGPPLAGAAQMTWTAARVCG